MAPIIRLKSNGAFSLLGYFYEEIMKVKTIITRPMYGDLHILD